MSYSAKPPSSSHGFIGFSSEPAVPASAVVSCVNEGIVLHVDGPLDHVCLEAAWHDVLRQHPVLRMTTASDGLTKTTANTRASFLVANVGDLQTHDADALQARVNTHLDAGFAEGEPVARMQVLVCGSRGQYVAIALHPLACDGWSKGLIAEDLARFYRERMSGKAPIITPEAESELAPTDASGESIGYWRTVFPGGVSFPMLPQDADAHAAASAAAFVRHSIVLDEALVLNAKQFAAQSGASVSTLLLAAFSATLAKLANAEEVSVAVLAAGQLFSGMPRLAGQHAMWLPVGTSVDPKATFPSLVQRTSSAFMDAFEHPCPDLLSRLLPELKASPRASTAPRVTFSADPDLNVASNRLGNANTLITLTPALDRDRELHFCVTAEGESRIRCDLYVNRRLFAADSAARWLNLTVSILREGLLHAELPMSSHNVVQAEDLSRIRAWNHTGKQFAPVRSVDQMVEEQVARTPDDIAVEFLDEKISYGELNRRANRLARHLKANGVVRDSRVAICVNRGIPMIVALLAALKAGAAYQPLDPAYPEDRLGYMLKHGAPKVLLTEASLLPRLGSVPAGVTVVDVFKQTGEWSTLSDANPDAQDKAARSDADLAYVIYTSGSTGEPKGVAMPHRALVNLLHWQLSEPDFREYKRTAQFAALGFDVAFQEVFSTLCAGGTIVMLREETRLDAKALFEFVRDRKIERLFIPFVALQVLSEGFAAAAEQAGAAGLPPIQLREVITAGEQLRIEPRIKRLFKYLGDCKLLNHYGPTESHVVTSYCMPSALREWSALPPIGKPIANTQIYILDAMLRPVPIGVAGELYIGGVCVARGYLNRPDITADRFVVDPFDDRPDAKMYKTGDLARWRSDGEIEYLGRNDFQVKIRGFRVELGEVESKVASYSDVKDAVVVAREDVPGIKRLVAYVTTVDHAKGTLSVESLRRYLAESLPEYMVPSAFVVLDALPVTPNGKLDRRGLPAPGTARPEMATPYREPVNRMETVCATAFAQVLGIDKVGRDDNFFELGGNSLLAMRALEQIRRESGKDLAAPVIFEHPTPATLAAAISEDAAVLRHGRRARAPQQRDKQHGSEPVAIIGMAGRFPGAASIEQLWENLVGNKDAVSRFGVDALDPAVPHALRADPNYVFVRGLIDDVENFDAAFFGISAREAEVMDPQHRIFLEISWECLERAGYAPNRVDCSVGVFAGVHSTGYLQHHVLANPDAIERVGDFQVMVGNEKDYVATRVSYKLNLDGPAVTVQTACSTSLVAIIQAVEQLRLGQCDMALAGAAAVTAPYKSGYRYEEGAMLSRDGTTRTFDAEASGTVFSDGAAVVLLKRLSDAIADGDQIFSVIRGVGMNNDGGGKASFTAPSSRGQSVAILRALEDAAVSSVDIGYVEAHGTATPLGDPVEIDGLTRAFKARAAETNSVDKLTHGSCKVGSIKSNIGHLVAAAGAAGVIKTSLALSRELIPASIHFQSANTKIPFSETPFVVADKNHTWARRDTPRLAGVSSFGVGGTNAHVVLEEAPATPTRDARANGPQVLRLSARTAAALQKATNDLATRLDGDAKIVLSDAAWTLDVGRARFPHRLAIACDTAEEAAAILRDQGHPRRAARNVPEKAINIVFVFPGQGAQYAGMGRELYKANDEFRSAFDACVSAMASEIKFDLQALMFADDAGALVQTEVTQPATFAIEYALARMWLARGLRPSMLIGHSVGEFVAAVVSGVMRLEDAAKLVAKRGALLQAQPRGSMLSVRMAAAALEQKLPASLSLAAENGANACVVSGPEADVSAFAAALAKDDIACKPLHTSHAFHSAMMDAAVPVFQQFVSKISLASPQIPILSTVSGIQMTDAEATSAQYWANHLRAPVRFSPAIQNALSRAAKESHHACFIEVGPRASLSALIRQHFARDAAHVVLATLNDVPASESLAVATAIAHLWTLGHEIVEPKRDGARRVLLPTTPFERKRYWLDAKPAMPPQTSQPHAAVAMQAVINSSPNSSIPSQNVSELSIMSSTPATSTRKDALTEQVRTLFEDVSGADLASASASASFLELGLDSLTLTQAAIQLKKKFKLNITFRQLMEQYRNMGTLAEYLDSALPKEADPVATSMPVPASASAGMQPALAQSGAAMQAAMTMPAMMQPQSGSALQNLIQQQMALMSQQLALLAGGGQMMQPVATMPVAPVQQVQPVVSDNGTSAATPPSEHADEESQEGSKAPQKYDVKKAFGAIARIHTTGNTLTPRQASRLDAFIRRYTKKTAKSKAYTVAHRAHLADPRVVNNFRPQTKEIIYQIVIEKSKGSHLWDLDGNEYVDALNGFGMSLFGWQPDFIEEAIRAQHAAGYDVGPMSPLAGEVAKMICDMSGFDRAGFCNTGSEAVMAAIRIARTVTGRSLMVVFAGSYHGTFDEVIVRAGRNNKGIPAAPGIMSEAFGNILVLEYGTPETLEIIRQHADELAAVLVEPVQSRRADFQPKEFLREVRAITEKSGTCLIFDEVITGFRSHQGGVQSLFGIKADLGTYGKVVGGGYPIGVVAGKREFMDALDGGAWQYGDDSIPTVGVTYFAGTFVRHPLALAAAKATLQHMKAAGPDLQASLNLRTAAMADELNGFCAEVGAPITIKNFASLWRTTFLEDHPLQDLLFAMMRSRGVHILDNFPCFFTTAHTAEDVATIKSAFKESVLELQEADLLPRRKETTSKTLDASKPPVQGARIGKDPDGNPAWFVPNPDSPGKYLRLDA